MKSKKYFILAIRILVGLIFIFSGITKIINPLGFAQDIQNYQIVPEFISFWTALILPWLELICGIFLLTGILVRGSSFWISSMLFVFILLIISVLVRGQEIDCGCFGFIGHKVDWTLLLQDLILFSLSLTILVSSLKRK
ncbi:DoxX family membrane protein [Candidatus Aminicenantes bacterium AC-335-A11]|jgi:uncharacterized membrane protein YphA (DoxX/SURF4 family)|nr:DoxX family membrane protein [SCandidatus Aminicenantes bacterium Aminicenantia_JdfR_composite]MCP2606068.1 DoxX family membrane protein [Candidatus Aminicenantes bacterium AC-708-I09]MCP2619095.1 DoxX family membrane protein [Candidatus Aminicenantes bacterium AC-335-A11]